MENDTVEVNDDNVVDDQVQNINQDDGTQAQTEDTNTPQESVDQTQAQQKFDGTIPYNRFQEVNQQKNHFKDEAEKYKEMVQRLTGDGEKQEPTVDENLEPSREQFSNDNEYYKALGYWAGRQGFNDSQTEADNQAREIAQQQQADKDMVHYNEQVKEVESKYANYHDVLNAFDANYKLDPNVLRAITTSDVAGDLAYAVASNPEIAQRIATGQPASALMEIGVIVNQIKTQQGSTGQPNDKQTNVSNMPKPISMVGGGKPNNMEYSDNMSQDDYNALYPYQE